MAYTLEKLDNEPIVIVTYAQPWQPSVDIKAAEAEIATLLEEHEFLYRIDDLRESGMIFPELVEGMAAATEGTPGSMTDPRIRGVLIGSDQWVEMASSGMKQEQYGATDTPFFPNREEALAYVRAQLATG